MIRSLTLKWVVTLMLTSLLGLVLAGLFFYLSTQNEFNQLRMRQLQTAFVEDVTAYFQDNQGWEGIETRLRENLRPFRVQVTPQLFALADADGVVIAGFGPFHASQRVSSDQLDAGIPIIVDGERIGTALLAMPPPELDPREQGYLRNTRLALLAGAIAASFVALLIGILLSRHFLSPLKELTNAISAVKQGDLAQQVPVRTTDELGKLAQAFNQMSAELSRANQLRKQMTADIAHDLRTPLMVISGYLEALRDGTLQPTAERFDLMNQEATLLRRLIEDLRTLSLADAGELKLVCLSVQSRELLAQVQQSFEPIAAEQQVNLRVEADDTLPAIQVDRERMVQVLENLVSNALRYTPAEGVITLRASQQQDNLRLAVTDTGPGIPEDQLMNIFERFYRIEESRSQNNGESGLGLAIAKSIVEAHHGTIAAESQIGVGTSIMIDLPLKDVALP